MGRDAGITDIEYLAAVKMPNDRAPPQGGYNRLPVSEYWQLAVDKNAILSRPDDEVIWVTDIDSLVDELNQRAGGDEVITYAAKASTHGKDALITTVPIWKGPLVLSEVSRILERNRGLILPAPRPEYGFDPENGRAILKEEYRTKVEPIQNLLSRVQRQAYWDNHKKKQIDLGVWLEYEEGAGEERRRLKKQKEEWARANKTERRKQKRYEIKVPLKDFRTVTNAYHQLLYQDIPVSLRPSCTVKRKHDFAKHIVFSIAMLRLLNNPHHQKTSWNSKAFKKLKAALLQISPSLPELKKKAAPYSTMSKYLSRELAALKLND